MSALIRDRNTYMQDAGIIAVPAAAGVKIFAGALVAADTAGDCVPGRQATDLSYLGRAEEFVDNSAGVAGARIVLVRRLQSFKWANDGTVTKAHLMKTAFIVDDQTISATDGGGTRSAAGLIVKIEWDGIWVEA